MRGIVITHGTDTLEETAYFLSRVVDASKPVVLTAAMRPASSREADGPGNLADAIAVAARAPGHGVVVVVAGQVHSARAVRKVHPTRLDAFSSGDAGPIAGLEEGQLRQWRAWPQGVGFGVDRLPADTSAWPRVEIVTSYAGASGAVVRALCASGVQGLVVAATGNGTLHHELEAALLEAQAQGVHVLRSSRCLNGRVLAQADDRLPSADDLTPVKARVELMLGMLCVIRPPSA